MRPRRTATVRWKDDFEMFAVQPTEDFVAMSQPVPFRYPVFSRRIIIVVGGFGSGKTEVSVNLTKYLAGIDPIPPAIVDLDLVNPYFRSREAEAEMEAMGIKVIVPRGGNFFADLPILLPEVKGAVESGAGRVILDVGGDSQGARALGSLSDVFPPDGYDMLMVLNSRRPFTGDLAGCCKVMSRIEATAKMRFTGLIANSHMIEETDPEVLWEGYHLAREVGREMNLPLAFLSAKREVLEQMDTTGLNCPILPLTRSMLKPWEKKTGPTGL
ncbi:MAG: cobalamin biosynthesis protein CbiA [candidate division Zixibacteria bacterium]|nr:cobalamin biosynthesis protein CbiA [candidate division Zixibacteria bacterium]